MLAQLGVGVCQAVEPVIWISVVVRRAEVQEELPRFLRLLSCSPQDPLRRDDCVLLLKAAVSIILLLGF